MFVGSVSDNFNERIEQKIFHCEIVVDAEKVKREERAYKKNSGHYRFHGRGRQRPHERNGAEL